MHSKSPVSSLVLYTYWGLKKQNQTNKKNYRMDTKKYFTQPVFCLPGIPDVHLYLILLKILNALTFPGKNSVI